MTTETILTDFQLIEICQKYGPLENMDLSRAIEQAALQSPEVQALKRDKERMRAALKRISAMDSMSYHTLDSAKITAKAAMEQE